MRLKNGFRMSFGGDDDPAIHGQQFPDDRYAARGMTQAPVQRSDEDGGGRFQWFSEVSQATNLRNGLVWRRDGDLCNFAAL